ncbi:MAG: hypothetical protein JWM95_1601 [Gemmatimonadetes bacterium]|nr:hypothetical protein [Gemmatimonadota bacterium]
MASHEDVPIGDVVDAKHATRSIDETLEQLRIHSSNVRFKVSGSENEIGRVEAEEWIRESDADGFSRIRFIVHRLESSALVELAASTRGGPETKFQPSN